MSPVRPATKLVPCAPSSPQTRFRISFELLVSEMKPTEPVADRSIDNTPPEVPVPDYRPVERFWPYVDLPEQPTEEELAALNPELSEALFGTPKLPFSISIEFPRFEGRTTRGPWRWRAPRPSKGDRVRARAPAPGAFLPAGRGQDARPVRDRRPL